MFDQGALFEYLSSPEGINKITIGIILVGAINAIFITYSVRTTFGAAKKEREKLKVQQDKIDKLFPKKK
jgi:mannose/fructose/N-acetylgalactosamine-specific phosphotransferase system component IID